MSGTPIVDDLSDGVERPKLADHCFMPFAGQAGAH